jgi:hypothetical protein
MIIILIGLRDIATGYFRVTIYTKVKALIGSLKKFVTGT